MALNPNIWTHGSLFDTMNHCFLLSKLPLWISQANFASWFKSCLTGSSFTVSWQSHISLPHPLATGVPQSPMLGPLLSVIYVTSVGPIIHSSGFSYYFYTDNTQLYTSFPTDDPHDLSMDLSLFLRHIHMNEGMHPSSKSYKD